MRIIILCMTWALATTALAQDIDVTALGAKPDGVTLNTEAIQSAIDQAHARGGGRVIFPKGEYLSGTVVLKSNVELHFTRGATLLGSTDPSHYFRINRWKALIMADQVENIKLTGKGTLDGQGAELALHMDSLWYIGELDSNLYKEKLNRPHAHARPQIIEFSHCKHIEVRDLHIMDAASWVQSYNMCENLTIEGITVHSFAYWNNDGIDIIDCKNVRIANCDVSSGDDGICLKSSRNNNVDEVNLCENIVVENCRVRSSANAVKLGSISFGGFRNITIRNIKVYDTHRSAITLQSVHGGVLEDILVENISVKNTGNAIFLRIGQRWIIKPPDERLPPGILRNVVIRNVKANLFYEPVDYHAHFWGPDEGEFYNEQPAMIVGLPGHPVENVTLENIRIVHPGRGNKAYAYRPLWRLDEVPENYDAYPEYIMFGEIPSWGFYVRHARGIVMKNVSLKARYPDYRPPVLFDDVFNSTIEGLDISGDDKPTPVYLHQSEDIVIRP